MVLGMPSKIRLTPLALALLLGARALAAPDAGTPADPKLLERARAILQRAPLIDTHNDLPYALMLTNGGDLSRVDLGKRQPELPADNPRHREGRALTNLGLALREVERFEEAISACQDAAAIFRETGDRYSEGMVLSIEPMVNACKPDVRVMADGWTAVTKDGSLSAHFEHTVAVTADGPRILTARDVPVAARH